MLQFWICLLIKGLLLVFFFGFKDSKGPLFVFFLGLKTT